MLGWWGLCLVGLYGLAREGAGEDVPLLATVVAWVLVVLFVVVIPPAVYAIWWTGLILTLVVFVPLAVYSLHRTWRAARSIQRYAAETLTAAAGIVDHTRHVTALDTTITVAGETLDAAGAVERKLNTVATVLEERWRRTR